MDPDADVHLPNNGEGKGGATIELQPLVTTGRRDAPEEQYPPRHRKVAFNHLSSNSLPPSCNKKKNFLILASLSVLILIYWNWSQTSKFLLEFAASSAGSTKIAQKKEGKNSSFVPKTADHIDVKSITETENEYVLPNGYNIEDLFNMPSYLLGGKYPRSGWAYSTTIGREAAIKYPNSIIGIYGLLENHEKCYTLLVNNETQNREPCHIFPKVRVLQQAVTVWGMMNPTKTREVTARLGEDVLVVHLRSGDKGQIEKKYLNTIVSESKRFNKTLIIRGVHTDNRRQGIDISKKKLHSDVSSLQEGIANMEFFESSPDAHLYMMQHARNLLVHKGGFSALGALLNEGGHVYFTELFENDFNISLFENLKHQEELTKTNGSLDSAPPSQNAPVDTCPYVLVTSVGGVGSTSFLGKVSKTAAKVNHQGDLDGFKHKPATWWKYHNATSIIGHVTNEHYSGNTNPCFHKALVIIDDPIHAIESTYRFFKHQHINKLKEAAQLGTYGNDVTLLEIYEDIAKSGIDQTGFAHYIESWYAASLDRSNWPEIKLVTTKTLYEEAVDNAQWLGIDELEEFAEFHCISTEPKTRGLPDDLKERVSKVFENVTVIIDQIEVEASVKANISPTLMKKVRSSLASNVLLYSLDNSEEYSNMQSINDIDASIEARAYNNNDDKNNKCNRLFIYLPDSFAIHGHGSQINAYILSIIISTYLNRALLLLEPPILKNWYVGGSQFGCPIDAFSEKAIGIPSRSNSSWFIRNDFPMGFSRLVQHPAWLSHGCSVPQICSDGKNTMEFEDWKDILRDGTFNEGITCTNADGSQSNVVVTDAGKMRQFLSFTGGTNAAQLSEVLQNKMSDAFLDDPTKARWATNLGATTSEAETLASIQDPQAMWDYVLGLLNKAGFMKLQPWIARDVKLHLNSFGMRFDKEYSAIHVRRGDKLAHEARGEVERYWQSKGCTDMNTLPTNYVPFVQYLNQWDSSDSCTTKEEGVKEIQKHNVYIATDDPIVVKQEIDALDNHVDENTVLWNDCHELTFYFNPTGDSAFHLHPYGFVGKSKEEKKADSCFARYHRTIASIGDMMILSKARTFIGDYNSNWGRLIRIMRVRLDNTASMSDVENRNKTENIKEMHSGKAKHDFNINITRTLDTRIAFGSTIEKAPGV